MKKAYVNKNARILWENEDKTIVAVITGFVTSSANRKTGDTLQTWIIRADVDPVTAVSNGDDAAICFDCPHRKNEFGKRSCYVNIGQAPFSVYKSYKAGNIAQLDLAEVAGRPIRIGSYGDPAAVPFEVWERLLKASGTWHLGYTRQWSKFPEFANMLMASCMTPAEMSKARDMGFRAFTSMPSDFSGNVTGAIECRATAKKITCENCRLCSGKAKLPSIWIASHGSAAKAFAPKLAAMIEAGIIE